MFNKFKQKLADGVEGVSAGRQTPLSRSKETRSDANLSPVGRAQAQNNGRIEENNAAPSDADHLVRSSTTHPLDGSYTTSTPLEISRDDGLPSDVQSPRRISRPRRLSTSSNRSTSSIQENRIITDSDIESSSRTENMSHSELRELYLKQDRSLKRYKNKLSEVVDAYKTIQKENEKLEGMLTSGQDKQLRKIKELKEIIELEQEGKRHLEESLRLEMGEKDEKISVLETQIGLLKTQPELLSPKNLSPQDIKKADDNSGLIQKLQDKINLLNTEMDQLKVGNEQTHAKLQQAEEEKKAAIDGVMGNMHEILNEQEDLRSQVVILRDELKTRDITILRMREDELTLENRLRSELEKQIQENALGDLQSDFQEKEAKLKNLFADKVHDLQRVMEESEKQKQISQSKMDSELIKKSDEILILNEQLNEWKEKENKMKNRIQKVVSEKEELEKSLKGCQELLGQEKIKTGEHASRQSKLLQEKQDEFNEQIAKIKRSSQTKIYDMQDQLRRKTNELNETVEKHKSELESKLTESQQHLQTEHAKSSRKLEVKISEMKKAMKELRQKANETVSKNKELETRLEDTLTETDQTNALNLSLVESGLKIEQLNCNIESLSAEVSDWKEKYYKSNNQLNTISQQCKEIEKVTEEKAFRIQTLLRELEGEKYKCECLTTEKDLINQEMEGLIATLKEEENTLQNELNNLKTKFSYVEEESKALTHELHEKVIENEYLTRMLDQANKDKGSMEEFFNNELSNKNKDYDILTEKYRLLDENKLCIDHRNDGNMLDLEKSIDSDRMEHEKYMSDLELKNTSLLSENDEKIQMLEAELLSFEENQEALIDIYENKESILNSKIKQLRSVYKEKLDCEADFHKKSIDELELKHKEDVEKLKIDFEQKICDIESDHQKVIVRFESQMAEDKKLYDFNDLTEKHLEDRNILLKQIEEQCHNLNQMNLICQQKDKEYALLSEKLEQELVQHLSFTKEHEIIMGEKLSEQEKQWTEKLELLESKSKKILAVKDQENDCSLKELESKHRKEMQVIEDTFNSKEIDLNNQQRDSDNKIYTLKKKMEEVNLRSKESVESYETEISKLKLREKDARSQLEQIKSESSNLKEHYEKEIGILESKILENKNIIEEMKFKVTSGESSAKDIDEKFSELHIEKSKLEQKIVTDQRAYEDKIRSLENEIDKTKCECDDKIRTFEDELSKEKKTFETDISGMLLRVSEVEEAGTNKLLEMKKKAEVKINRLKKEQNVKNSTLETTIKELQEKTVQLEADILDQRSSYEEKFSVSKAEYEMKLSRSIEEYKTLIHSINEKFGSDISNLKEDVLGKSEKISKLEKELDNATIVKMDSLKMQKMHLEEEHEVEVKKLKEETSLQVEIVEKRLNAKIDEKDFEHNSEIKLMMKQFQKQLGNKDQEIQQAIQDAIESAQIDERRIINEYDEQIMELQKELHLREKDMLELQDETQRQLDLISEERETVEREHQENILKLEQEYNIKLEDMLSKHEETLSKQDCIGKSLEDAETKMNEHINEVERNYALKIEELEEYHKNNLQSQEKKFKKQLKQAKIEMRKLLAAQGVSIPNGGDFNPQLSIPSNPNSDNEMEQSEVIKLKEKVSTMSKELSSLREREKCLALQAEQTSFTPTKNDRPATLHLSNNINDTISSPPKSPQPMEFEYLRNILFNFMMGKQRKQMAKVLTAIVHFTPSEVQQILNKVEEQESVKVVGYFSSRM